MAEAGGHFEFYRRLANDVEEESVRDGITFGNIEPEYGEEMSGLADIVLFDGSNNPVLVIERVRSIHELIDEVMQKSRDDRTKIFWILSRINDFSFPLISQGDIRR